MDGGTFKIKYGDQSFASGNVGFDSVTVGGANVPSQAIGLANNIAVDFIQDVDSDGLMGLGFKSINNIEPTKQDTFFGNLAPTLKKNLFTANLRHATVGGYEFGNIDTSQFSGKLAYTDVDSSQGFWQFTSNRFKVGANGQVMENKHASPAIADTGTSLLLMDDEVVQAYYSHVQGASMSGQGVIVPCDTELPDFYIQLAGDYMGKIPGNLLSFQRIGTGMCFGGLQSNQGQPVQVFGDVMFKAQFVVFDGDGPRLGFAPHA